MESIYYPYTKKQAIEITSRYFGISKTEARLHLEKDVAYRYGKKMKPIGERISAMDCGLKEQAKLAFYED